MSRLWKSPPGRALHLKMSLPRILLLLLLPSLAVACHRPPAAPAAPSPAPAASSPTPAPAEHAAAASPGLPEFAVDAVESREGIAAWYDVPAQSLAGRRAWPGEMTAASDALPMNAYVRVRRADAGDNGKSVVVRITDDGIHRKSTLIELDRQAAETLGMVERGEVRVRVEMLALKHADTAKSADRKDVPPTAAQITDTPAATREQEKAAAAAKAGGATPP